MHQTALLRDVGIAILAAAALAIPAHVLRVPLLLAYIGAGIFLGPHLGLSIIESPESISTLSSLGLILLMFILGLEIDVHKLLKSGKAVLLTGLTQTLTCAAMGWAVFSALNPGGLTPLEVIYLSAICALSSTLVVVKILSDRMELDSLTSRITLGILVIQDLWAISFLAVQHELADARVSVLALSIAKAGLLVALAWALAKYVLPRLFAWAGRKPELLLVLAMAWCFLIAGGADLLHLSPEMGALIAGVTIAAFPYHTDLAAKISSLRDFFITLFFVSVGLKIQPPTHMALMLSAIIVCFLWGSRFISVFPTLRMMGYGNRTGLLTSLNLSQLSEFALVLTAIGIEYGHVREDLLSAFVLAFVVTSLASSLAIPASASIYGVFNPWLERLGIRDQLGGNPEQDTNAKGDPVKTPLYVLLGFYRDGSSFLNHLLLRHPGDFKKNLHVVDYNPEAHRSLRKMGVPCSYGDLSHTDTLKQLDLSKTRVFICTLSDHQLKGTSNLKLLRFLRALAPHARTIMTADTLKTAHDLYHAGADYVFIPRIVGTYYLADILDRMNTGAHTALKDEAKKFLDEWDEIIP